MEKEQKNQNCGGCKVHACFQEPQTLKILNFLQVNQKKVIYKGLSQDQGRRQKDFPFQTVSFITQKLKHIYNPIIKEGIDSILRGQSNTVLILGNEESKKQKLLIGQSQNIGFLLQFVSQLFQTCYQRELQDRVTIKLSCWEHRDGKITDLLDGTGHKSNLYNWIAADLIEGDMLVGLPEIIIRNMKSALKVIRIFMKRVEYAREKGEDTENLVFTVKLEIDHKYDKQGNVIEYLMPKFHIVKLAVPYLKSPSKHAPWFITLFNYLQSKVLERIPKTQQVCSEDEFSNYLRDNLVRSVSKLHCLSVFNNKMSANDCLTMLKFSSYLQQLKLQGRQCILKLWQLNEQKLIVEGELLKAFNEQRSWIKQQLSWLTTQQCVLGLDFQWIANAHSKLMQAHNLLEYEYANLLTIGCDKLQKYIFNEEVSDYFYAKKIVVQPFPELQIALSKYLQLRKQVKENELRFIKKLCNLANRIKKDPNQAKQCKYLLNSKIKTKSLYQKLFQIYGTMSTHFLYEKDATFIQHMKPIEQPAVVAQKQQPLNSLSLNLQQIMSQIEEKDKARVPRPIAPAKEIKKRKTVDQMQMMFTNTNANLAGLRYRH